MGKGGTPREGRGRDRGQGVKEGNPHFCNQIATTAVEKIIAALQIKYYYF